MSQRTKDALAVKRAQGVRLGGRARPPEVVERIVRERREGSSLSAIADGLVADGVSTAQGGATWWPATIRKVLAGQDASALTQRRRASRYRIS